MSNLIVADVAIRKDNEGRYCLNDLHRAAGGDPKHYPKQWLRYDKAQELIDELIVGNHTIKPVFSIAGRYGGTYVVKELVYAYTMWISPAFHLKVIRAYDELGTGGVATMPSNVHLSPPLLVAFNATWKS